MARAFWAGEVGNNPELAAAVFGRSELGLPPLDFRCSHERSHPW
jgi:hypothetical protein